MRFHFRFHQGMVDWINCEAEQTEQKTFWNDRNGCNRCVEKGAIWAVGHRTERNTSSLGNTTMADRWAEKEEEERK